MLDRRFALKQMRARIVCDNKGKRLPRSFLRRINQSNGDTPRDGAQEDFSQPIHALFTGDALGPPPHQPSHISNLRRDDSSKRHLALVKFLHELQYSRTGLGSSAYETAGLDARFG